MRKDFLLLIKRFVHKFFKNIKLIFYHHFQILGDLGSTYVKDLEENFLNELVDYQNNTVTMDLTLKIPALWENWNGLVAGEKYLNYKMLFKIFSKMQFKLNFVLFFSYKFRLLITCPEAFEEQNAKSFRNITNSFDFDFKTNAPPIPLPLEIEPLNGTAMLTEFKLTSGAAKDLPQNFPIQYTFGYFVNNLTLVIASFYENTVTHAFELPLAGEGWYFY